MIEKVLKRLPLAMLLIGKRRSGKTMLLINMLNSKYFRDTFDKIYIFSPTIELDKTWEKVRDIEKENYVLFDKMDLEVLEDILSLQKRKNQYNNDKDILVIIDDFAEKLKGRRGNVLEQLATKGRHFKASYIFTSQKYNSVPTIIRNNSDEQIFFHISNNQELKTILEENESKDIPGGFESLLHDSTDGYNYLLVVKGKEDKYYKGNKLEFKKLKLVEE